MLSRIDFAHLRLFRDFIQTKSLSRGAAMNGITQSAASQHLQELESRLGVELLDRSRRPFQVTPAGRLYYDLCRELVRRQEEFEATLKELKQRVEGTVKVAAIYSVGLSDMSLLEQQFTRMFPGTRLAVEYLRPDKVYEAVLADRADLGIVSYPESTREIAALPWREEEMVVAVASSHALARKRAVDPKDLEGMDFVAFDEDLPIRHHVDRYLREQEVSVHQRLHFDNIEMMKEAVALGSGVSILPARIMQAEIEHGRLVAIPLTVRLARPVGIIHRKRKKFSPAAEAFLELLEETPAGAEAYTAEPVATRV